MSECSNKLCYTASAASDCDTGYFPINYSMYNDSYNMIYLYSIIEAPNEYLDNYPRTCVDDISRGRFGWYNWWWFDYYYYPQTDYNYTNAGIIYRDCNDNLGDCSYPRIKKCKTPSKIKKDVLYYRTKIEGEDKLNRCCKKSESFTCDGCDYEFYTISKTYSIDYELVKPSYICSNKPDFPDKKCDNLRFLFQFYQQPLVHNDTEFLLRNYCSPESKCFPKVCDPSNVNIPSGYSVLTEEDREQLIAYYPEGCVSTGCPSCVASSNSSCCDNDPLISTTMTDTSFLNNFPYFYLDPSNSGCYYGIGVWGPYGWNNLWGWHYGYGWNYCYGGYNQYIGNDCCEIRPVVCPYFTESTDFWWRVDGECVQSKERPSFATNGPYNTKEDCDFNNSTNTCVSAQGYYAVASCCNPPSVTGPCYESGTITMDRTITLCDNGPDDIAKFSYSEDQCYVKSKYIASLPEPRNYKDMILSHNPVIPDTAWDSFTSCRNLTYDPVAYRECVNYYTNNGAIPEYCSITEEPVFPIELTFIPEEIVDETTVSMTFVYCVIKSKNCGV